MRVQTGDRHLWLPFDAVRASMPRPELTAVPGAPRWLIGAWNHHGQAVAVIDVCCLWSEDWLLVDAGWIVLVEGARGMLGVLAHGPASESTMRPPTETVAIATALEQGWWIDLDRVCDAMDAALGPSDRLPPAARG